MQNGRALIVESQSTRGGFSAARYLAAAGWTVGVGCPAREGLAYWSRATSARHLVPSVEDGLEPFLEAVAAAVSSGGYELVLPAGDAEALALAYGRERIPARVPGPEYETAKRGFDKLELDAAARRAGLATPRTVVATDAVLAASGYPIVVKSRFHWLPEHGRAPARLEAERCDTLEAARRAAAGIRAAGGEPIAQEVVDGIRLHVHLVADRDHRPIVMVPQEASTLCFPPRAGGRVRSWSVPLDGELASRVAALVSDLGWIGFTSVTFLRDPDGEDRVNDFNGRIPMTLEASCATGPNLMAIWTAVETGRPLPAIPAPRAGVRVHWLEADLRRALKERRGGLLRDLRGTLRYARGATHMAAKRDDPLTTVRYLGLLVRQAWRRRRPGAARR